MLKIRPFDPERESVEAINDMMHAAYKPLLDRGWRQLAAWQDAERAGRRIRNGAFLLGLEDDKLAGAHRGQPEECR